jgi:ribose transport system ATP-binding protein
MRILAGEERPDEGVIARDGVPLNLSSPLAAQRAGIVLIHQELVNAPNLSVAENMALGRLPRTHGLVDQRRLVADAREHLKRLNMHESIDVQRPISSLSVARQQIVEIAKALSVSADVIIMDEPTASLSEEEAQHLRSLVHDLAERGGTVIYISHRLQEITALADRATVLRDGKMVAHLKRAEVSAATLTEAMLGREADAVLNRVAAPSASTGEPVLQVRDLCQPGHVDGVSLDVHAGEIVVLYGLVGAGRTELLHAIFGIDAAAQGEIQVDGNAVAIKSPADAIRLGIGLLPEDRKRYGIMPQRSVAENIVLSDLARLSKFGVLRSARVRTAVDRVLKTLNIKASPHLAASHLSGGNAQRVVLGKWLNMGSRILMFDEPTKGIDVGAKAEIYDVIEGLASDGHAILIVSSDLEEVLRIAHKIVIMLRGRVVAEVPREEATTGNLLRLAFGHIATVPQQ